MRVALVLAILLTPLAAAEPVRVAIENYPRDLAPGGPSATTIATIEIDCEALLVNSTVSLVAQHRVEWITATIAPIELRPDVLDCESGVWRANATLSVRLATDAPAFATEVVAVGATVRGGPETLRGVGYTNVTPAFFSSIQLSAPTTTIQGSKGVLQTASVVVAASANAGVRVRFDVEASEGDVQVAVPSPITLAPDANATVRFQVVPGDDGSFRFVARSSHHLNASLEGGAADLAFTVERARGTPGIAFVVVLAAVALVAFARRRAT